MEAQDWIIIAAVALVLAGAASAVWRGVQRRRLRQRFGPEYDRTVDVTGSPRDAERELRARQRDRDELDIRRLEPQARQAYAESWQRIQAEFVEAPVGTIRNADDLVIQVMRERGYPVDDVDRQTGVISVDHPGVVDNYRVAHQIAETTRGSEVTTEDMRRAMLHFRSLFDELLGESASAPGGRR